MFVEINVPFLQSQVNQVGGCCEIARYLVIRVVFCLIVAKIMVRIRTHTNTSKCANTTLDRAALFQHVSSVVVVGAMSICARKSFKSNVVGACFRKAYYLNSYIYV